MNSAPFSNIYLAVSTPSAGDSFCGDYVHALMNTKTTIEHFGGNFAWIKYQGCSDLCHARNDILFNFLKMEKYTHLLKVDDDMGWEPSDVIRLLSLNKDFVAGVGPKRKLPIEWCCSNRSDETGIQQPVLFHNHGGTLLAEVNYVGAGFVLISRACAQRMVDSYPDLMYVDVYDGQKKHGLYDPVTIINGDYRERYFDDFAFCYRWRKIGGKVLIVPDIHLKHNGNFTFEGMWQDSFTDVEEEK